STQSGDLPQMQYIDRHTIDMCYRSLLGDKGVDWFIDNGESGRELETHLPNYTVLLLYEKFAASTIYFDDQGSLRHRGLCMNPGGICASDKNLVTLATNNNYRKRYAR
ncbi:MAG: hypothetical protein NUK54_10910, partial [Methanothrix sp.]|nr:hypothetical protein [Methanothrix sp.]